MRSYTLHAIFLIYLIIYIPLIHSETLEVPGDYENILHAYWAAENGDTILVKPGVYHGDGWCEVQLFGKSVNVISEKGAGATIIDGWGIARGFLVKDLPNNNMVIQGFTFRDCVGVYTGAVGFFRNSPATLKDCVIIRGKATRTQEPVPGEGGGIRIWGSDPIIQDCIIQDCWAPQGGGFNILEYSNPLITRCIIDNNFGSGIQISTYCNPIITDCRITNNQASSISWSGGIGLFDHTHATIERCVISGNINNFTSGGAIQTGGYSESVFTNCLVIDNHSFEYAGGILAHNYGFPEFNYCTIAGNTADEMSGTGLASMVYSNAVFKGCIIWNPPGDEYRSQDGGTIDVSNSDFRMPYPGSGNICEDPLFQPNSNYQLSANSPCIDRISSCESSVTFEGIVRPCGNGYDMGAWEYCTDTSLDVEIDIPQSMFYPGDECYVDALINKSGPPRENILLWIALEVYGQFFFWPEFTETIAFDSVSVPDNVTSIEILPSFTWPENVGEADGLHFYAAMTDVYKSELYGDLSEFEFGWRSCPRPTATPTITPTCSITSTPTNTSSPTCTPFITSTPTATTTPEPTSTATSTPSVSPTGIPTDTPSLTPTATETPTPTETPTESPTPTNSPSNTPTPTCSPPPTTISTDYS